MSRSALKEQATRLPRLPGVYLMKDQAGTVIYVGKAKQLRQRVSQYFQKQDAHSPKTRAMVAQVVSFSVIVVGTEWEALVLESSLIKRHQPRYNILLKDDKAYPYVRVDMREVFPKLEMVARIRADGASYFGSFGTRQQTQALLRALSTTFRLPTCGRRFPQDQGKGRPCLNQHLGKCLGYCLPEHGQAEHQEAMRQVLQVLGGKSAQLIADLEGEMHLAAEALDFERAGVLRDRLQALLRLESQQTVLATRQHDTDVLGLSQTGRLAHVVVLHYREGNLTGKDTQRLEAEGEAPEDTLNAFVSQYYAQAHIPKRLFVPLPLGEDRAEYLSQVAKKRVEVLVPQRGERKTLLRLAEQNAEEEALRYRKQYESQHNRLQAFAEALSLPTVPQRIEAFDISHTAGADMVGAMAVFLAGKPSRKNHRSFPLPDLKQADDLRAMEAVLKRRYAPKETRILPDLILMDGGREQVRTAERVLEAYDLTIPVFGMVKDDKHKTRALLNSQGAEIALTPSLFSFVGQMQEETHRTALGYHQKRHKASSLASALEDIAGVGKVRRQKLLAHFQTMDALRNASAEALAQVVPKSTAQNIYERFHPSSKSKNQRKE